MNRSLRVIDRRERCGPSVRAPTDEVDRPSARLSTLIDLIDLHAFGDDPGIERRGRTRSDHREHALDVGRQHQHLRAGRPDAGESVLGGAATMKERPAGQPSGCVPVEGDRPDVEIDETPTAHDVHRVVVLVRDTVDEAGETAVGVRELEGVTELVCHRAQPTFGELL